jgi:hypothetical protein
MCRMETENGHEPACLHMLHAILLDHKFTNVTMTVEQNLKKTKAYANCNVI